MAIILDLVEVILFPTKFKPNITLLGGAKTFRGGGGKRYGCKSQRGWGAKCKMTPGGQFMI